jgi:hypothetical protein
MSDFEMVSFGLNTPPEEPQLEFIGHYLIGGNKGDPDDYCDTKEEAMINFAKQFAELIENEQGKYLFIRRPPLLTENDMFEGGTKYRMIGRFGLAKLKEKNT